MKLTEIQRLKLLLYESQIQGLIAQEKLSVSFLNSYLKQIDPQNTVKQMQKEIQELTDKVEEVKKKYEEEIYHINRELGIDLSKCSFDDETGEITSEKDSE